MGKKLKYGLVIMLCLGALSANAYDYYDYPDESYWENRNDTYCSPEKEGIFTKIKNAFVGQPVGYTPPVIEPSPYINSYGPSYMRGYYGTNGWRDHNVYNPVYSGAGIRILD